MNYSKNIVLIFLLLITSVKICSVDWMLKTLQQIKKEQIDLQNQAIESKKELKKITDQNNARKAAEEIALKKYEINNESFAKIKDECSIIFPYFAFIAIINICTKR